MFFLIGMSQCIICGEAADVDAMHKMMSEAMVGAAEEAFPFKRPISPKYEQLKRDREMLLDVSFLITLILTQKIAEKGRNLTI